MENAKSLSPFPLFCQSYRFVLCGNLKVDLVFLSICSIFASEYELKESDTTIRI